MPEATPGSAGGKYGHFLPLPPLENPPEPYVHDPTIPRETLLWRRVSPKQTTPEPDGRRPNSDSFKDRSTDNTISVYIANELLIPERLLVGMDDWGVFQVMLGVALDRGRCIMRWDPNSDNPGHCLLFTCPNVTDSMVKRKAGEITKAGDWRIMPIIAPDEDPF